MNALLCIDASQRPGNFKRKSVLVEGKIFHFRDYYSHSYGENGIVDAIPVYLLEEDQRFIGYEVDRFIPLSDIDETELIKEREDTKERIGF